VRGSYHPDRLSRGRHHPARRGGVPADTVAPLITDKQAQLRRPGAPVRPACAANGQHRSPSAATAAHGRPSCVMPPGQKRPRRNFEQVFVVPPGPIAPRLVDDLPEACPARPSPARTRIRIAHVNALRTDCFRGRKINPSDAFAGQNAGVTQVGERVWLVSFNAVRSRLLRGRNHPGRADRESLRRKYCLCPRNKPSSM
jgi:hypothetical protein